MAKQPSYQPLQASTFFGDGQSSRQLVAGTVARGHLDTDLPLHTGRNPPTPEDLRQSRALGKRGQASREDLMKAEELARGKFVESFPFPVTQEVLQHGYDRYMIYCIVCHDPLGTGHGRIVERGYTAPPSYHIPRLRSVAVGHLFAVITEGYGSMPSYGDQIPVRDRWAIAAYIRALQLSQRFPADQMTPEMRQEMQTKISMASAERESP